MTLLLVRRAIAAAVALALLAAPAQRALAASCYATADIEAQEAMLYQTRLMVLSDTCGGDVYRDFTVRNRDSIVAYQRQLMDHYRRTGSHSPAATLDSYLTRIANETSLSNGREQAQALCDHSVSFLTEAKTINNAQFRERVAQLAAANARSYRRCAK